MCIFCKAVGWGSWTTGFSQSWFNIPGGESEQVISYICLKLSEQFHSSMLFEPARKWESTSARVRINVGRSWQKRLKVLRTCRSSSHLLLAVIIATATATVTRISVHATSGPTNDHGMRSVKKVHMEVQSMSFLWKRAMGNSTGEYQTDNVPGELSTQVITNEMRFILKLKPWDSIVWGTA